MNGYKNVTIESTLTVAPKESPIGAFTAAEQWDTFVFEVPFGCADGESCARSVSLEPAVAKVTYEGTAAGLDGSEPTIQFALPENNGGIPPIQFKLPHGRLAVAFLGQVLIPAMTNNEAHTLGDLAQRLINCTDLADELVKSDFTADEIWESPKGHQVSKEDAVAFCQEAMTEFGKSLEEWAADVLEIPDGTVDASNGTAKLVDSDGDGKADGFADGIWTALISGKLSEATWDSAHWNAEVPFTASLAE